MEQILIRNMNSDDSDKDMPLGDHRLIENLLPRLGGVSDNPRSETIKGTLALSASLPSGTNTVIGDCKDRRYSRIFFFIHNSQGQHSIFVFDERQRTISPVMIFSGLDFDLQHPIGNTGIIDQNLWWVDGKNPPGYIDVARAMAGQYTNLTREVIRYIMHPPMEPPAIVRKYADGTILNNLIADSSWQFAYRYVFKNNQKSVFSPLSKTVIAEKLPLEDDQNNTIEVSVNVDDEIKSMLKEIEVAYRVMETASGPYYIFHTIRNPTGDTYVVKFQNNKSAQIVPTSEVAKLSEPLGIVSATASVENRVIMANIEEGFDLDEINVTLTCSTLQTAPAVGVASLKYAGVYPVGVALYEADGKTTGIVAETTVSVPQHYSPTLNGFLGQSAYLGKANIVASNIPDKYKYFQLLLGREQRYALHAYLPVNVFFYRYDKPSYDGYTMEPIEMEINERIYFKSLPSFSPANYSYLHLQLPANTPFVPTGGGDFFVRLLSESSFDDQPVIDVVDDMLVINKWDIEDWETYLIDKDFRATLLVEVYSLNKIRSDDMFEIGEYGRIENGQIGKEIIFPGDQWGLSFAEKQTKFFHPKKTTNPANAMVYAVSEGELLEAPFLFSPTPTFNISTGQSFVDREDPNGANNGALHLWQNGRWALNVQNKGAFTPDYTKFASNRGRRIVKVNNAARVKRHLNIRISNNYYEGSFINRLHEFDSDGTNLDVSLTPITKLARADDKVVLSIHERNVTSLYIGKVLFQQHEGNVTVNTDEVVGDRNILVGDYGSINPESVVVHETAVYGFDLLRGEPWRYENNGLTPLASKYKMKNYFSALAEGILNDPSLTRPIITGAFDEDREIYFLQFPSYQYQGKTYPAQTLGFSEKMKGWRKYTFGGSFMSYINKSIVSYRNGAFYLHYGHVLHNNFYGSQAKSRIQVHVGLINHIEKVFKNMALDSNIAWDVPEITNPKGQKSKLSTNKFIHQDNMFYADFLRDENTNPATLPPGAFAIMDGDELQSHILQILLETPSQDNVYLDGIYIGYIPVFGNLVS